MKQLEQKLDWAIYLKVNESVMVQRALDRGLVDDTASVIDRLLYIFRSLPYPFWTISDGRDRLLIDREQTPEAVVREIARRLKSV